ncbi:NifB/NifX family molybdenum-iron cluster-binding protein [Desulforudis sp. 1190]|uniref:NifB/NifX family molybdenum-iron cluster-binding protein n=1 Tax=Desulforudis sp. 1190 TaxID=3416136 RepID=UPI003CF9BC1D
MRVAVSAVGPRLTDRVDPRFGRCACFIIYDTEGDLKKDRRYPGRADGDIPGEEYR